MADKGIGKLAYSHFVSAQYSPLDATAVAIGCIADVLGSGLSRPGSAVSLCGAPANR